MQFLRIYWLSEFIGILGTIIVYLNDWICMIESSNMCMKLSWMYQVILEFECCQSKFQQINLCGKLLYWGPQKSEEDTK